MNYRQTVRGTISAADIITAYQEAFSIPWWRLAIDFVARLFGFGAIFQLADSYYQKLDEEAEQRLVALLETDKTDMEKYIAEDHDCDDFTFRLMGVVHCDPMLCAMPIFITWVSWIQEGQRVGHAILSYYKSGIVHIVKIVEPQNDDVYQTPKEWRLDLLCG